jgi:thymidylate synthase (FAD)
MADAVVEVEAPRDITRQLIRHRSFSFQEFSQRYSDDIEFCDREPRKQDPKNRQNSIPLDGWDDEYTKGSITTWDGATQDVKDLVKVAYQQLREHEVAKECARVLLPEGLTMSRLYVKGSFRSWLHYLDVRDDPGVTQHEHVMLAREIRKVLEPIMPTILGVANG